jgi:hypothetical protein
LGGAARFAVRSAVAKIAERLDSVAASAILLAGHGIDARSAPLAAAISVMRAMVLLTLPVRLQAFLAPALQTVFGTTVSMKIADWFRKTAAQTQLIYYLDSPKTKL